MSDLSTAEMTALAVVKAEVRCGQRNEYMTRRERRWLDFLLWRKRRGFECNCGRSDGERCHCEDDQ